MLLTLAITLHQILNLTYGSITSFIASYGYFAIMVLMVLEAASFPVASEVVLPIFGALSASNQYGLNVYVVLLVTFLSSLIGMAIDYYVAYFLGKDVIYKNLHFFHIKRETLETFERWFASNGNVTVFVSRLIPVIRGPISFVAGFAEMDQKRFYAYSMLGSIIWDTMLVAFGYFAIGTGSNAVNIFLAVSVFVVAVYAIYHYALKKLTSSHD